MYVLQKQKQYLSQQRTLCISLTTEEIKIKIIKNTKKKKMMACVRQSRAAYKRALQLQKDKQSEEEACQWG